ncbi:putative glycosyltransferase EpsJ [Paraburkholderia domus]|jgi:glycosyltransferase involved in cell wall biosynthesis|uniref:Glycosyltransferase EpsJ n=1 Tax=Paraburkholderia domus TaxID=2793075 RepID=A0A9N8MYL9_9BURK|nr:glycosyltransferase family A protein [Paraburkholderia domus]MBK5049722.1 glycosyltransferase family 2 protein [Burkholderia sp. R-70006]MBK5059898.1 glycosyltransferase family 2 protein [Burkholderia sp. R-70199]MBK5087511.1 glycosyltransferase family 2 protein [Burkholderia sp. R-69927]MBK5121661.1 glycosyltransferase family 2 protein [Burkholderia sp. R-69980]MBK5167361.1 glycosyltransferase family 2 protein [Burkholderia sp. R-70211]MBK5181061.1 glycosyltransferase family 2 protein [Bu
MSKVSIVVPCFNQEEFIAEALESVLRQSYDDWECIIVNDGSTDGSGAIIERYTKTDRRFRAFTKENGGVAAARNFGFAQASGALFVPLDGDDKLHPDFLRRAVGYFTAQPDTDLVHCKTKRFGATGKVWRLPEYSYEKLLWQNMIVNTAMYRREAFLRVGGYSLEMIHGFEDWEFYVRLLSPQSKVCFIDAPLFLYRVKNSSRSTEQMESGKIEESQRLIYARNSPIYAQYTANPISIFGKRMKDFAPSYTARYRRQARYIHAAYWAVIAGLLGVGILLVW